MMEPENAPTSMNVRIVHVRLQPHASMETTSLTAIVPQGSSMRIRIVLTLTNVQLNLMHALVSQTVPIRTDRSHAIARMAIKRSTTSANKVSPI